MQKEKAGFNRVVANRPLIGRTELIVIILTEIQKIPVGKIADPRSRRTVGNRGRTREGRLGSQVLNRY